MSMVSLGRAPARAFIRFAFLFIIFFIVSLVGAQPTQIWASYNDPAANVPSGPGSDCKVTDYKLENNVATYKVACTQPMAINGTGELKYAGPDAYTGTLNIDMGGQNIVMTMDAKRLGDCGSK